MALGALETSRLAKIPRRRALKPRRVVRWPAGCWTTPMDAGLTSPTSYHITSTTQPNLSARIWVALDLRPVFLPRAAGGAAGECARGDPSIVASETDKSSGRWGRKEASSKSAPQPREQDACRLIITRPNDALRNNKIHAHSRGPAHM